MRLHNRRLPAASPFSLCGQKWPGIEDKREEVSGEGKTHRREIATNRGEHVGEMEQQREERHNEGVRETSG